MESVMDGHSTLEGPGLTIDADRRRSARGGPQFVKVVCRGEVASACMCRSESAWRVSVWNARIRTQDPVHMGGLAVGADDGVELFSHECV